MAEKMKLRDYLSGVAAASTPDEVEAALQAPYAHPFSGPTWSRICNARVAVAHRICDAHPLGRFVPRFGDRRVLSVCGETYKVARGGNATGVRYVWHYAEEWAVKVMQENGLSQQTARSVWGSAFDYPHRSLMVLEKHAAIAFKEPAQ